MLDSSPTRHGPGCSRFVEQEGGGVKLWSDWLGRKRLEAAARLRAEGDDGNGVGGSVGEGKMGNGEAECGSDRV